MPTLGVEWNFFHVRRTEEGIRWRTDLEQGGRQDAKGVKKKPRGTHFGGTAGHADEVVVATERRIAIAKEATERAHEHRIVFRICGRELLNRHPARGKPVGYGNPSRLSLGQRMRSVEEKEFVEGLGRQYG